MVLLKHICWICGSTTTKIQIRELKIKGNLLTFIVVLVFYKNCHLLLPGLVEFLTKIIEYKCFVFGFFIYFKYFFCGLFHIENLFTLYGLFLIKIFQALSKANICRLFFGLVFSKKNTRFLRCFLFFSSLALNVFCCVLCVVSCV